MDESRNKHTAHLINKVIPQAVAKTSIRKQERKDTRGKRPKKEPQSYN
jgi:hypothetical protein